MTTLPPTKEARALTISFGVTDVEVTVYRDGVARITSPAHLPTQLLPLLTDMLETWMIDLEVGEREGVTAVLPEIWFDYFAPRTVEVTHD